MKLKLLVVCTVFTLISASCQQSFNRTAWDDCDSGMCNQRKYMLDDLLNHHQLKGMTRKQLVKLLGDQNYTPTSPYEMTYNIITDYGWDIDPVYIKNLTFYLNKNSVVTAYKVEEWRRN